MRVTPLDIRQKTFEKNFRGYEKDEVNAFLLSLSLEWERIVDENKELRFKLEAAEREVAKLREVENSLYKTLKTAEDTGANVIEQARAAADLHLRESQMQADSILNEAKTKARNAIEESESRAKEILAEMEEKLKALVENYKAMEASRNDLLMNFKHLATDALDRVERSISTANEFDPDKHMALAKREAKRVAFPNTVDFEKAVRPEPPVEREKEIILEQRTMKVESQPKKVQKSFFDEIG
ncbi:MAG: DivIVA domain-containing protein [Cyclobacteriaceae bacterium]|nr:DivIVA domain-containing protein [Cyclobacteriaceae bacterium]MDH4296514.1 DivIVA domain-containing protein [Cyclobacteriaceae bacterium]MDH5248378.1 DivIVA domain-containing protein [Cyclobacteriaceae bacterium]